MSDKYFIIYSVSSSSLGTVKVMTWNRRKDDSVVLNGWISDLSKSTELDERTFTGSVQEAPTVQWSRNQVFGPSTIVIH